MDSIEHATYLMAKTSLITSSPVGGLSSEKQHYGYAFDCSGFDQQLPIVSHPSASSFGSSSSQHSSATKLSQSSLPRSNRSIDLASLGLDSGSLSRTTQTSSSNKFEAWGYFADTQWWIRNTELLLLSQAHIIITLLRWYIIVQETHDADFEFTGCLWSQRIVATSNA